MSSTNENAGVAMGLVIAAGASTGLGAAVVFFPSIVKLASRRVLAGSLGFSAGVMTYVSFIEIFLKSRVSFEDAGFDEGKAYGYATLCFFGGVGTMMLLNVVVSLLLGGHHSHRQEASDSAEEHNQKVHPKSTRETVKVKAEDLEPTPPCCTKDPVNQLNTFQRMASVLQHEHEETPRNDGDDEEEKSEEEDSPREEIIHESPPPAVQQATSSDSVGSEELIKNSAESKRLVKMGMSTALAIGLHNFPEGLATFVAALNDPKVGAVLAVAIAIHNIPEGLCVALPIYYATGKRLNAFLWALLSGASEIVAALLGWAILANRFSDTTYAVLFGLVAGMMVVISVRELLPTAHFYDPEDTVVTNSYIAGMVLIALSLVLFQL